MNKAKLYLVYDLILKDGTVTISKLNNLGISKSELDETVSEGKFKMINDNEYIISSYDSLYQAGVSLTNNREYDRGIKYLEKYYELNPKHNDVKLLLISSYISRKQYQKIFPILDILMETDDINEIKDYMLILYLLSMICPYPDKYKDIILNLEPTDLLYSNDGTNELVEHHNHMRNCLLQNKIYKADMIFNNHLINTYSNKNEKEIIIKLLNEVKNIDHKRNEILETYAKNKEYQNIISIIDNKKSRTRISFGEELIYKITKDIIRIKEINKIPRPLIKETDSIKKAIDGKNYYLALKLNQNYNKEITDHNIKRTITMLLIDINKMISSILKEYKERMAKKNNTIETTTNNSLIKKRIPN